MHLNSNFHRTGRRGTYYIIGRNAYDILPENGVTPKLADIGNACNLNLDVFFQAIAERLENPEREVVQHALRVLTDFIPVIPEPQLDDRMATLMPDLVGNLGNIAPSVRKGATDCIRAYLNNTKKSDDVVRTMVHNGLEIKAPSGVVVGITMALPFFIRFCNEDTVSCIVKTLFEKMVQITYQEVALRTLIKIKSIVGDVSFAKYAGTARNNKDFEVLCQVYDNAEVESNKTQWSDANQNVVEQSRWRTNNNNYQVVVVEHEGPAITMQIHEESRQTIEEDGRGGVMKILPNEEEADYEPRRTPRRVRFGGEIVKLRTPDSDSNHTSDLDNPDQTITINNTGDKPTIQINYNRDTTISARSQIPVLSSKTSFSEPNSPVRKLTRKTVYNSFPNLHSKVYQSKIPIKKISDTTTIQIKFTDFTKKQPVKERNTKTTKLPVPKTSRHETCRVPDTSDTRSTTNHKPIEIFHNLTRSPERVQQVEIKKESQPPPRESKPANRVQHVSRTQMRKSEPNRQSLTNISQKVAANKAVKVEKTLPDEVAINLTPRRPVLKKDNPVRRTVKEEKLPSTADKVLLYRRENHIDLPRKIRTADQLNKNAVLPAINVAYNSFKVCSPDVSDDYLESSIPTNDNGECLTCSSSGSDNLVDADCAEKGQAEVAILSRLNCKEDWKIRQRELDHLKQMLKEDTIPIPLEDRASTLIHFLFSCEHDDRLQLGAEEVLGTLFNKLSHPALEKNLHQSIKNLCRIGSPAGVRLSILLIKRIGASKFLDYMYKGNVFNAKSSKIKEGSLQIMMSITRVCPSTEINVPKAMESIVPLLKDRKKRIRRAVLETIAALAHISTPTEILATVNQILPDNQEKDYLKGVVRTRLSRKQLPTVAQNGNVSYSTPSEPSELKWISCGEFIPQTAVSNSESEKYKSDEDNNSHLVNQTTSCDDKLTTTKPKEESRDSEESDGWSQNSYDVQKDQTNGKTLQIWAVDPWTLSSPVTLSSANGTLKPLYLIQSEQYQSSSSSTGSTDYNSLKNRRRSCSPTKRQVAEPARFISKENYNSLSADNIRNVGVQISANSASSSASGSSNATSWSRTFKSGIPVPVGVDSKIRFKSSRQDLDVNRGPVVVPSRMYRTKSPSPICTPDRSLHSRRSLLRQPFSSESETYEFYTPPAEPILPTTPRFAPNLTEEHTILESPRPSETSSSTRLDSQSCENLTGESPKHSENEEDQEEELNHSFDEKSFNNECHSSSEPEACLNQQDEDCKTVNSCTSLDNLDSYNTPRSFVLKSKSEINLICTSEPSRKVVSSAPALNVLVHQAHYDTLEESSSSTTVLPGSASESLLERDVQTPKPRTAHARSKSLCRRSSIRLSKREVTPFPDSLGPFSKPREGLSEALELLDGSDWELTLKGLQGVVRVSRHHPELVENQMHGVCVAVGKQVRNLRSQVSRAACLASSEMFATHKKAIEMHVEDLACPLLHRTADTNKFLRSDANAALDSMCLNIAVPKVVSVITTKGSCHQNAIVRCASARLLGSLTNRLGSDKIFQLPKDTRDRILFSGANMLLEGNLDTRKHAKIMFGNLSVHSQFYRAMSEAVPVSTMRHIQKTLRNLQ